LEAIRRLCESVFAISILEPDASLGVKKPVVPLIFTVFGAVRIDNKASVL
jgi:hypothetical protein